jgi:transcriptional regulator with XRE-family HTH domain
VASLYQEYTQRQQQAREDFGRMLRLWRERNGWTQYTVERWGKEAGFRTVSSGNISMVEQGKAGDLRAQAHFQLADVNRRLADQDWGNIKSLELRQAIENAQPITGDDGQVWGPQEFWGCYVGLQPVPEAYRRPVQEPMPQGSGTLAAELATRWRALMGEQVNRRGLDPIETLQGIARHAPQARRKTLRLVLAAIRDPEPGELEAFWDGEWLPERWIQAWIAELDGQGAEGKEPTTARTGAKAATRS